MLRTNNLSYENDPRVRELMPVHFDDDGFPIYPGPTIVLFQAPWCPHCSQLKPVWRSLANEISRSSYNDVTLAQFDCERYRTAAARWGITGYPTILIFKGKSKRAYTGSRDYESLKLLVQQTGLV